MALNTRAIRFNGSSDNIATANNPFSNANIDVATIEAWVKVDEYPGAGVRGHICNIEGFVILWINENGIVHGMSDGAGGDTGDAYSTSALPLGEWHLIEFNWSTTADSDLFVDGTNFDGAAPSAAPNVDSQTRAMRVGSNYVESGNFYKGYIGGIRISDIRRNTSGYTPPATGTKFEDDANSLMIWNLEEGTGTAIGDDSGNSKTGTLAGGEWVDFFPVSGGIPMFFGVGGTFG